MGRFTVDLLNGNVYLFSGDFTGSGSTPTSGSTYPEVNVFSSLPTPVSSSGEIYVVRNGSGTTVVNRKPAGFYYSTGAVWRYLGDIPDGFLSNNFQVVDSADNTKGVMFETSGITTNEFRTLTIQNNDGTIAYLTDLNTKPYIEISGATTLDDSHYIVNCVANTFIVSLPSTIQGRQYYIKNSGTGIITVDAIGTIDGESTQTIEQWESLEVVSTNGIDWIII